MPSVDWAQLAEIATVVSAVGAIGLWIVRRWLHSEFVGHGEHKLLAGRVESIERAKASVVNREEFAQLKEQVAELRTGVAVVQAGVSATGEGIKRVEHNVNLLLEHALQGEKA